MERIEMELAREFSTPVDSVADDASSRVPTSSAWSTWPLVLGTWTSTRPISCQMAGLWSVVAHARSSIGALLDIARVSYASSACQQPEFGGAQCAPGHIDQLESATG